ncbi:hypothetical protein MTO96_025507 [Rhipicephalus appendiculatus]
MDTQCSRKRTRAGSDSDEPAGPPKQAVTIAAEPPVLGDAAGVRVEQETPASVPAATTLPPEERTGETAHARALDAAQQLPASQRRGRRTKPEPRPFRCGWGLRHRGLLGGTAEGQGPGSRGCRDGPRSAGPRTLACSEPPRSQCSPSSQQRLPPWWTSLLPPTDTPAEDLRDIVIGGLLTVLQAVIEYLPEGLPLRDACLKAVNVPLYALPCT